MKILIYGGTSYIGSNLCHYLQSKKIEIGNVSRGKLASPNITNFSFSDSVEDIITTFKPNKIIYMSTCFDNNNIESIVDVNIAKPLTILKTLETIPSGNKIEFIHTGSYWQLGDISSPNIPIDLYSCSKKTISEFLKYYNTYSLIKCKEVILFGTYGGSDGRGKLLDYLIQSARNETEVKLSPGDQKLNLIDIQDLVEAFYHAINDEIHNKFCIRSTHEYSVKELVGKINKYKSISVNFGARPYRNVELMTPYYPKDYQEIVVEDTVEEYIKLNLGK